ncbi:NAD(P)/FAD-dependent oxidoreductase [Leptolyngbya sp. KIOST-1]|uniref:NAD(P)/FAD-dependent oxidoreductase n=1 Tax=Leptolyngbya sp. KIOST-1 TaxID=1229172 RepID=UPI0009E01BF7|nr:FAD-dependent oxidoreductase [Leptolyngbya sp. KIOST-1]
METLDFDVVIIGGGPAGCSCALYTARASLKTVILDKNPAVGALAITHNIANYPGVAGAASGEELLAVMRQQAVDFGPVYQRSQVYGLDLSGEAKLVYTPELSYSAGHRYKKSQALSCGCEKAWDSGLKRCLGASGSQNCSILKRSPESSLATLQSCESA